MTYFDRAFADVLESEGVFSDHASDPGGKTKYGITEAVARANGYHGPMVDLSKDAAREIYRNQYWATLRGDDIADISPGAALELFDTGVNMGVSAAGKFLQHALNALNKNGAAWPDMPVDGLIGPRTLDALRRFVKQRGAAGENVLLRMLNALQGAEYIRQTQARPASEDFIYGWFANRVR